MNWNRIFAMSYHKKRYRRKRTTGFHRYKKRSSNSTFNTKIGGGTNWKQIFAIAYHNKSKKKKSYTKSNNTGLVVHKNKSYVNGKKVDNSTFDRYFSDMEDQFLDSFDRY